MDKKPEPCLCCGASSRELLIKKDSWQVYRCNACSLDFLDPRPSLQQINDLYREDYFADQYGEELDPNSQEFEKRLRLEDHRLRFFASPLPLPRLSEIPILVISTL